MKDITTLIPRLQRMGNAIPTNMATLELRDAARRFLTRVGLWVHEVAFDTVEEKKEYSFSLAHLVSAGETPLVYQVQTVKYNGTTLKPTQYRLDEDLPILRLTTATPTDDTQYDIDGVSTGNSTFTITGDGDLRDSFFVDRRFVVSDSTGNDGTYTVVSRTYTVSTDSNVITVSETISDATVDGTIGAGSLVVKCHMIPDNGGTEFPDKVVDTYEYALVGGAAEKLMSTSGRPYTDFSGAEKGRIDYARGICRASVVIDNLGTSRDGSSTDYEDNAGGFSG